MNSVGDLRQSSEMVPPPAKPRLSSPLDYHNSDLVSRLLAATPPYLYNMPLVPQSFFFSEMLRSFVQAKNEQPLPPRSVPRRSRKRSWREASYERVKPALGPPIMDKPLELTTSKVKHEDIKRICTSPVLPPAPPLLMPPCGFPPMNSQHSSLAPDMLLPPPPPVWYPSLYPMAPQPPYGVDPLHFFIDLRVSGQIWDRKLGKDSPADLTISEASPTRSVEKRSTSPLTPRGGTLSPTKVRQSKHCSAFCVPHSRAKCEKREVMKSSRGNIGTHYIFQNLPRIYQDVRSSREQAALHPEVQEKEIEDGKVKCKSDLRALIGLELVVDYMKHEGGPRKASVDPSLPQGNVEVIVVNDDKPLELTKSHSVEYEC